MSLSDRQSKILEAIVKEFISTGQPVSSKSISSALNLGVSPATIRSEMAILYEIGYLEQPHTSAGRIPSHFGIRTYIDQLMKVKPLTKTEKGKIDFLFNPNNSDPDKLLGEAADALSDYTGYAAVTSALVSRGVKVRRLEFIAAGKNTVVIILIASNGVVRNKVCRVDFVVTEDILEFFQKFANDRFSDKSIETITVQYINAVGLSLGEYSRLFTSLILAVYELCKEISAGKYYVSGSSKLISRSGELGMLSQDLLIMIESNENLMKLFGQNLADPRILIGGESSLLELIDSSVMVTHYEVGGEPAGTVGLIGPTNINYSKMIPHLEYFAQKLGILLDEILNPGSEKNDWEP